MVDIGSNTVRLVIYETLTRIPIPVFNERADCRLALGLNETGKLNPSGVEEAMHSLRRFSFLSKSINVEEMSILALKYQGPQPVFGGWWLPRSCSDVFNPG